MHKRPLSKTAWRLLLVLAGATLVTALAGRLLVHSAVSTPARPQVDESDIADYVGNEACRPCHTAEFDRHQASRHSKTLRPMRRAALGAVCPAPGQINRSQYALKEEDGQFYFEVSVPGMPDKYQLWPLDYAFGSGRTGLSFVSMLEGHNVVEMKMSYFPRDGVWRVTPGQKLDNPAAAGNLGNLQQSRRCLGCHIIAMSRNTFVPRPEFFGVGCESCHGPGRAHIAAVKAGASDLRMAALERQGGRELNELCGKCHQTQKDVEGSAMLARMTYRFQPYGLMLSRCFRESGQRLSCLTCHDAHNDVSTDPAAYVRACLSCHASSPKDAPLARRGDGRGKVCPVNATSDCIRCHMPRREVLSALGATSGILMSEHRIAIYRDAFEKGLP
jgi:hypothetical protein